MDNIKNDNYFAGKISDDLSFIVKYTKDIDKELLESFCIYGLYIQQQRH